MCNFVTEIDRAFKQFVFECMDLAGTDANGFIITRDSEGLEHSAIPWDDPYPFFKGMIPHHEKEDIRMTPVSDERSGKHHTTKLCVEKNHLGLDARKPVFGGLRTTQAQISLRICAV